MNKYKKVFTLGIQNAMEYRLNFLFSLFNFIFPLTIQYFLWTGIFHSSSEDIIYGYTYNQMISYSVFAVLISKIISGGVEWDVLEDIKNGGFSKFIIRPLNYMRFRISFFLGQKSLNLTITVIVIFIAIAILGVTNGFSTTSIYILSSFISILLSVILTFYIYFTLSAISFWIEDSWGVFVVFGVVSNVLSGGVFPLDIFGDKIINIFKYLPFQYTIFFPVNIFVGKYSLDEIVMGLLVQLAWIIIMILVTKLVWHRGMKKYIAVGG